MELVFIGKLQSGAYVVRFLQRYWRVYVKTQTLEPLADLSGFFNAGVFVQTDPAEMLTIAAFMRRKEYTVMS